MEISKNLVKTAELNIKPELCPQIFPFPCPRKVLFYLVHLDNKSYELLKYSYPLSVILIASVTEVQFQDVY